MTQDDEIPVEAIARIIHEAHRALQVWLEEPYPTEPFDAIKDHSGLTNMVRLIQQGFPPEYVHQIWVDTMTERGWTQGPKDPSRKTHPDVVPWVELPFWEQQKVFLAFCIVEGVTSRSN